MVFQMYTTIVGISYKFQATKCRLLNICLSRLGLPPFHIPFRESRIALFFKFHPRFSPPLDVLNAWNWRVKIETWRDWRFGRNLETEVKSSTFPINDGRYSVVGNDDVSRSKIRMIEMELRSNFWIGMKTLPEEITLAFTHSQWPQGILTRMCKVRFQHRATLYTS